MGYSLAFGPDVGNIIGNLSWIWFRQVGLTPNPDYASGIPHQVFAAFQLMFAIITPALISRAIVERMRFPAYLLFVLLWATFVYDPLAHWVWAVNGWLRNLGGSGLCRRHGGAYQRWCGRSSGRSGFRSQNGLWQASHASP